MQYSYENKYTIKLTGKRKYVDKALQKMEALADSLTAVVIKLISEEDLLLKLYINYKDNL